MRLRYHDRKGQAAATLRFDLKVGAEIQNLEGDTPYTYLELHPDLACRLTVRVDRNPNPNSNAKTMIRT